MTATLADLLTPPTKEQVFALLLAVYQKYGFPTQSWQPFGTEQTRLLAMTTGISDLSANYIPQITAGGLLEFCAQLPLPDWLQLLAAQNFNVQFNPATFTVGNITLTSASGVPTATYGAGKLIAVFAASGRRYINQAAITIPPGPGSVVAAFQAEFAGAAYADPSDSGSLSLATPIPGVTLTNPSTNYTDVARTGSGTGTLTLGGSPIGAHQVSVRIDSTGASGVASWSYSIDGGAYVSAGAVATLTNIGGDGINVTLVNGASGTSFVLHDTFLFNTPGPWITTQGSDVETSDSLAQRCRDRWSTLSPLPTNSFYELLAKSTPGVGSQVVQVVIFTDAIVNNRVNIVVAGPEGALPPDAIAAIQTYVTTRIPNTDLALVVSPSTQVITYSATVTVSANQLATAPGAIETALEAYTQTVGINGTARIASGIELTMEQVGVIDVADFKINGVAANLSLGTSTLYVVPASSPVFSISYVTG